MANFNEKINCGTGHVLPIPEYFIYRSDSMRIFEQLIDPYLYFRKNAYRLCIQYKDTHPVGYFGDPTFDSIAGAIFIIDEGVVTYGDTWIEAVEISGEHVVCNTYVCGRFVSEFRIPAETFDRVFGLNENFPELCEKQVEEKNDLVEEAKRNIESCMNLLGTNAFQLERAMDAIKAALADIEDQKCELGDMLDKLTQKEER